MGNKLIFAIIALTLTFLIACQQTVKEQVKKQAEIVPIVETTGDVAVDAVGDGLNNVNSVDKDLSTDEFGDIDSGLADVENI